MEYETVIVERKQHIGIITLNRPKLLNVFSLQLAKDTNSALLELEEDADIFVVILKAAGSSFCAGIDLSLFPNKTMLEHQDMLEIMGAPIKTIPNMHKPVIAAVHGYVIAEGCGIVAISDLAIASDDAFFGVSAINVGLFCFTPALPLSRSVGKKKTLELLFTGDLIDAKEAERTGLVNAVVPRDKLHSEAMKLAEKLASKPPIALQTGKRAFYIMSDMSYSEAFHYLGEMMAILSSTEDATEGVTAFLDKRKPHWKGK